ncbi:MAG: hypothetical protein OEV44_11645 [Spirochaetota bacterium]|nr:hypothetical protein [Spirochaetota bacterium]
MRIFNKIILIILGMVFSISCNRSGNTNIQTNKTSIATPPEFLTIRKPNLYPEGIEYDAKHTRFLVSSLREGIIGSACDCGSFTTFIKNEKLVSTIGIRIDTKRNRLLVCNSDPGVSINTNPKTQNKLAGLGIFDLSDGKLIKYYDLGNLKPGAHFCNDIALDNEGNAYITDSFSPIIYKVDNNDNASIFLTDKQFEGKGFNLNGIVAGNGFIIVAKSNEGLLFKIPLNDPAKFTQIKIDRNFPGADGLLWSQDGTLILIANLVNVPINKVFKLSTNDNWSSAKVVSEFDTGFVFPTTGTKRSDSIYVIYSMLHKLFDPNNKEATNTFTIKKVKLN